MKKALSSLLVLALLLGSCSAFADTVSWSAGSGFKTDPSTFKTCFSIFSYSASTDYTFNWNSSTKTENGYTVYTAKSSDSVFTMKMYVKNSKVYMIYGEASGYSSSAATMGSWLGAAMFNSAYSLYYCEHNDLSQSVMNSALTELISLVSKASTENYSESQLRSGIVLKGKMCGYPYGLEIKMSGNTASTLKIHLKMYIVPSSGKITTK